MGLRFQNVMVPPGSTVSGASLMLTIDESHNPETNRYTDYQVTNYLWDLMDSC